MGKFETILPEPVIVVQPYSRSVCRCYHADVHGIDALQALEQHLDEVRFRPVAEAR